MRDQLTSAQRMRALAAKDGLDRVPVNPMISIFAATISNMSSREFYLEPEKALNAQLWAIEFFQYDGTPSYNIPDWSGWDFGGDMVFSTSPRISLPKLIKHAVEGVNDLENLKMPDVKTAPAISKLYGFASLARELGYPVSIPGGSPMGIAQSIVGSDLLLRWMRKEPTLVNQILRIATDYLLTIADYYIEAFGAENCSAFSTYPMECHAMISPAMFEKFSLPYIIEIHKKLIKKGVKRWLIHLCGDHTRNLRYWKETIPLLSRSIFSIGHEMDIEATAKTLGEDYIIGGNVPTTLLQIGNPEEIYEVSRQLLVKMKNHPGGFILMPACALPPNTPPINVFAMIKAANTFGRYDTI